MEGAGFGKGCFKPDASLILRSWRYRTGAAAAPDRKKSCVPHAARRHIAALLPKIMISPRSLLLLAGALAVSSVLRSAESAEFLFALWQQ